MVHLRKQQRGLFLQIINQKLLNRNKLRPMVHLRKQQRGLYLQIISQKELNRNKLRPKPNHKEKRLFWKYLKKGTMPT